jgi:hypothetical protein
VSRAISLVAVLCIFEIVAGASGAEAARSLGPPSKLLGADRNFVTAVTAVGDGAPGRFRFTKREDLVGVAPAEVEVRLVGLTPGTAGPGEIAVSELVPGATYVLGFSSYRRYARFPNVKGDDPAGPAILDLPGVGPALFEDTPAVRRLVRAPKLAAAGVRDAVLAQLARPDLRSRRLAVFELFFRSEVRAAFDREHADLLARVLADPALEPLARDFLLRSAALLPAAVQGGWIAAAARQALAGHPDPQLDPSSALPALLRTALRQLARSAPPRADDAALAARFLVSNSPAVAEAALQAVEAAAPDVDTALDHVERALRHPGLTDDNRRLLERFRDRRRQAPPGPARSGTPQDRAPPGAAAAPPRRPFLSFLPFFLSSAPPADVVAPAPLGGLSFEAQTTRRSGRSGAGPLRQGGKLQ